MSHEEDSELVQFRAEMRAHVQTVNENISKVQEQHLAMMTQLVTLSNEFTHVKEDVSSLKTDVGGLVDLKKHGVGFLAAITLTSSLLYLGVKYWWADILASLRAP